MQHHESADTAGLAVFVAMRIELIEMTRRAHLRHLDIFRCESAFEQLVLVRRPQVEVARAVHVFLQKLGRRAPSEFLDVRVEDVVSDVVVVPPDRRRNTGDDIGRGRRLILCPSSGYMENVEPSPQEIDNWLLYIEEGVRYAETMSA